MPALLTSANGDDRQGGSSTRGTSLARSREGLGKGVHLGTHSGRRESENLGREGISRDAECEAKRKRAHHPLSQVEAASPTLGKEGTSLAPAHESRNFADEPLSRLFPSS